MSDKLINFMQESVRLDQIIFNRHQNLLEVMRSVMLLGSACSIDVSVIEAILLVPAVDSKRVNLHHKFKLSELQRHTSPESIRLAVMYSALNNPIRDLWVDSPEYDGLTLKQLRTIDTVLSISSEIITDDHLRFAQAEGIQTRVQEQNYRDLEDKRRRLMSESLISSDDLLVQIIDPQVLIYVAWLAQQPNGVYTVWGVDSGRQSIQSHLTPSQARKCIDDWHKKLTKVHLENLEQQRNIADGSYRQTFQFTPI